MGKWKLIDGEVKSYMTMLIIFLLYFHSPAIKWIKYTNTVQDLRTAN